MITFYATARYFLKTHWKSKESFLILSLFWTIRKKGLQLLPYSFNELSHRQYFNSPRPYGPKGTWLLFRSIKKGSLSELELDKALCSKSSKHWTAHGERDGTCPSPPLATPSGRLEPLHRPALGNTSGDISSPESVFWSLCCSSCLFGSYKF